MVSRPEYTLKIIQPIEFDSDLELAWRALFGKIFGLRLDDCERIFEKYLLNDSYACLMFVQSELVASYSGLVLPFCGKSIFLSTDTMSDGTFKGASVVCGKHLYEFLGEKGVVAVCGFPNKNIIRLRERKLGWTMKGCIDLHFGVPFFWRFFRSSASHSIGWRVNKPCRGHFRNLSAFVGWMSDDRASSRFGLVMTMSSAKPGIFFFKVPSTFYSSKKFGYRLIDENIDPEWFAQFEKAIDCMNANSIDVP